jgi:acyl-CoA synthetase (AMP-forming)/AMP-acid ligase II/acyl carrier protein
MLETAAKEAFADILNLVRARAARNPDDIALEPAHGAPISYLALARRIERNAAQLAAFCPGRRPRIGIVLPNGADMAVTLLSVCCAGVAIPFNPAYRAKELESYFAETRIEALIVQSTDNGAAVTVAKKLGLPVLRVTAGAQFEDLADPQSTVPPPNPDHVALVLLTSGSTGRSKAVPLTHRNVCTSAGDVCRSMTLAPADRCLSMWEQYHVGGLVDLLLAPLYSGGTIICTDGFSAPEFFRMLGTKSPSWFQGVPTTLNELLVHARRNKLNPQPNSLRLIRSVAAPLSPQAMDEVQALFGKPVIQTYGMTEAGPLITSTGLAPELRKPGSVGRSCGPEVRIIGPDGKLAGTGVSGQIAIRGPNVFSGYENDPATNAERFRDGWFFTGDIGYLDAAGDMFITGRINQLINRGGEKVNPQEVDDSLLEHPAVAAAASFAVDHRTLGEDISAAVVLHPGAMATEEELRSFLSQHLAVFKIPSRIFFLDELPRNAIGKIDRRAVADATAVLGQASSGYVAPRNDLEKFLSQLWAIELDLARIGIDDDFRSSGGDSLSRVRILLAVEQAFGIRISDAAAETLNNVETMAAWLVANAPGATPRAREQYVAGKVAGLDAYDTAKSMDMTLSGPEAEEAVAEQRLSQCKTAQEFDAAVDALLLYKTPQQILSLVAQGFPGRAPVWQLSAYRRRRKRALLLRQLKRELANIGTAVNWQRQSLSPDMFLYSDRTVPAKSKTLLVGFSGNAMRLMMPTYCVLTSLNPSDFDLLLLRDSSRRHYEAGVPSLGRTIAEIAGTLKDFAEKGGYRNVIALGTSAGGLAAICAADLNRWTRAVVAGCDIPANHPDLMQCLDKTARNKSDGKLQIRLLYSDQVARDNEAALAVAQLYPDAIKIVDSQVDHNLLYQFYKSGRLRQFFATNFGAV